MSDARKPGRLALLQPEEIERLFSEVEGAAGLGSYVWEPEGRVLWSEGMFRLFGADAGGEGTATEVFFTRVHPADLRRVEAALREALSGGDVPPITYRIVRPDGSVRWLRGSGSLVGQAGVRRFVGTVIDVTDLHEGAARLEEANAILGESQRAAGVGSYLYEPASGRLELSGELRRILGIAPDSTIDAAFSARLVHPDDRERQAAWSRSLSAGEIAPPLLTRVIRPDGQVRHVESRGRLVTDAEGHARVLGVTIDVTSRVELEEQLRHAAKLEAVGTLAAGVAHDFNNYLTVIGVQLELLSQEADAHTHAGLAIAREAVSQSANLTRQLLAFARRQPWSPRRLEIGSLLGGLARLVARLVDPRIRVTVETGAARVEVDADPGQLESAFMNMAVNARDAMPDGGTLAFSVQAVAAPEVETLRDAACAPGPYARIRVRDTGTGIRPEHLARVFEPYFSTKEQGRGTGLGLASAYGAIRQHGGFVRVESAPGTGTRFDVYLPLASGAAAPVGDAAMAPARPPAPIGVLLVEDMQALREAVAEMLRRQGHRVVTASDGEAALGALETETEAVDVVLSDVLMPRMGGRELARVLRERRPELPVVLMTGYADEELSAPDARGGGEALLRKPFGPAEVAAAIEAALAPPRPR